MKTCQKCEAEKKADKFPKGENTCKECINEFVRKRGRKKTNQFMIVNNIEIF